MDFTTNCLKNAPGDTEFPIFVDADAPDRTICWREYASLIKRTAAGLQGLGLTDGECVALVSRNDMHYHVLGHGVVAAGGVFVGIAAASKATEMLANFTSAHAKWVFAEPELLERAEAAAKNLNIPGSRILVFDAAPNAKYSGPLHKYSDLLRSDESGWKPCASTKEPQDRACFRILTSGSSGMPKAAEISHANAINRGPAFAGVTGTVAHPSQKKCLHLVDMHHISGISVSEASVMGRQVTYITKKGDGASIIDLIQQFGITTILLHPRLMGDMTQTIQAGKRDRDALRSLDNVRVGGAVVDGHVAVTFKAMLSDGAVFQAPYGSTEAGLIANLPSGTPFVPDFVGVLAPGVELLIADEETHLPLGNDQDGEVCVRTPSMFSGYVNNKAATDSCFFTDAQGKVWHRTGDKGRFSSEHQQLAITGRFKENFKVGPNEVCPEEVDFELMKHPAVKDAATTSTAGRRQQGDYEPIAYVVVPDPKVTGKELVEFVASRISSYKAPTGGVVFCESIPRTSLGKLRRRNLNLLQRQDRSIGFVTLEAMTHQSC